MFFVIFAVLRPHFSSDYPDSGTQAATDKQYIMAEYLDLNLLRHDHPYGGNMVNNVDQMYLDIPLITIRNHLAAI